MSSTTATDTIFAATRLRSTGGTRALTMRSLVQAGMNLVEAATTVDEIDLKLGLDGRTLPEDVSDAVRHQVTAHREASQAAAVQAVPVVPEVRPRFESPVSFAAPATATAPRAHTAGAVTNTNAVPTLAELANGQTSTARPRYEEARPAEVDTGVPAEKAELTVGERSQLKAEANRRARVTASPERLAEWLVREGMNPQEANAAARASWQRVVAERKQVAAADHGDQMMAWLEIVGGIALLIGGLAAGWFVGFFLFIIIDGFRRLGS